MEELMNDNTEPRKEWATPELKKIDVEAITAEDTGSGGDGTFSS